MGAVITRILGTVAWGLATALAFSISPIFVRVGMAEGHSPHVALAVGITAAFLVYLVALLLFDRESLDMRPFRSRSALGWEVAGAMSIVTGSWLRYLAMTLVPLAIVAALGRVNILVILLLSRREITWKVWLGGGLIVAGAVVIQSPF